MRKIKVFLIFLLFFLQGCKLNNKIKIALDYTININHIGILVAIEKGFYKNYNLDVSINNVSDIPAEQQVAINIADFGISFSENVIASNTNNFNIESIYGIYNHNLSGFISKQNLNITNINDFKNKTFCGWTSQISNQILQGLLQAHNIDPSKLTIINSDLTITSDINNSCDIFWTYENWDNFFAKENNIEFNFIPINTLGLDFYSPVIIKNKNNHNNYINKFIQATNEGYIYAYNHIDESVNIFNKYNNLVDPNTFKNAMSFSKNYINQTGYQNPEIWAQFEQFLNTYTIYKNQKGGFSNEYISN